jgi:carbamoyl-phosphate synthase small subunit
MKAILALADGTVFEGESFGADGETVGEVVFNTSMTGYQEILTDPSYRGQLVAMTYPEIGNVGVNSEDVESARPFLQGFIVKEYWETPSNWRAQQTLREYLVEHGIPAIQGIDTRALVRRLRDHGAQDAVLSTVDCDPARAVAKAQASPGLIGRDLVREVTCAAPYAWHESTWNLGKGYVSDQNGQGPLIVAYDYGIKRNILRHLVRSGFRVQVVPATTPARDALALKPDGIFLSNGPGDPDVGPYAGIVRDLIGQRPIFGICLGHQMLGLALGGRTYKLKFGHHGANHPVKDLLTGKVEITSQNHGFCVDAASLPRSASITHMNLNDNTVEGFEDEQKKYFAVQYHPEAAPGPHDSEYLFRRFREWIARG